MGIESPDPMPDWQCQSGIFVCAGVVGWWGSVRPEGNGYCLKSPTWLVLASGGRRANCQMSYTADLSVDCLSKSLRTFRYRWRVIV